MTYTFPFACDSFKVDGLNLSYLDSGGEKTNLHFYHANGFPVSTYLPFLSELANDFRVLALELRGQDAQADGATSWYDVADDLIHFLDDHHLSSIIGVGHSIGGVATMIAAAKRPDLFSKIILVDPAILPYRYVAGMALIRLVGKKEVFFLAKRARGRKSTWHDRQEAFDYFRKKTLFLNFDEALLSAYVTYGLKESAGGGVELVCPPEAEARIFENYPLDVWRWPKQVNVPVLLVRGESSDVFFERSARRFCKKCPDARSQVIQGAGHLSPMEKPDLVSEAIRQYAK